jgi:predicted Zn-dependent protease
VARRRSILFTLFIFTIAGSVGSGVAQAQGAGLIRDTEIENTIRAYATPLLNAAGLEASAVKFHIVRDRKLNAFVAGGQRLFITTGLLQRSADAGQVIGVMAHEIGHIAGGHLVRLKGAMENAGTMVMISQILGIAVGVLAGDPAAGLAVGAGGLQVTERTLLKYSRTQERSADQAAVNMLEATGQSARGLQQFLGILADQELLVSSRQDPYVRTHPLTRDRIAFIRNHVSRSRFSNRATDPDIVRRHRRMLAKLAGFLDPPARTLRTYKADDNTLLAHYARAIAFYRIADLASALPLIDGLIAEYPDDPYFYELKGQMLFENGRIEESLGPMRTATRMLPDAPLLRTALAHGQIELGRRDLLEPALRNLNHALRLDSLNPRAWRLSATAYGRDGRLGMAALSLAEYSTLVGRRADAREQAKRALKSLKQGTPAWQRAQDILRQARRRR